MRELSVPEVLSVGGAGALAMEGGGGVDGRQLGVAIAGAVGTALAYSTASSVLKSFDPKWMVTATTFGWLFPINSDTHVLKQDQSMGTRVGLSAAVGAFTGMCGALALDGGAETKR